MDDVIVSNQECPTSGRVRLWPTRQWPALKQKLRGGLPFVVAATHRHLLDLSLDLSAIGLAAAVVAARVLASLLYAITPGDSATFAIVPLLLIVVSTLASHLPGRRAMRLDRVVALRQE